MSGFSQRPHSSSGDGNDGQKKQRTNMSDVNRTNSGSANSRNRNRKPAGGGGGGRGAPRPMPTNQGGRGPPPQQQQPGLAQVAAPLQGFLAKTAASSDTKFADVAGISAPIRAAVNDMRFEYMTEVQAQTLPVILQGVDCLAKAKTGTGKTLGFVIPALEVIGMLPPDNGQGTKVQTLILSPTRELAAQIETEARKLTKYMKINIVCVIGGTNIKSDQRRFVEANTLHLLIATPGRLIDHLENTPNFAQSISKVKVLVMDEADQLLEMGFKPAIDKILSFLPSKNSRQTLLFSATVPSSVEQIAGRALRDGYQYIDTVGHEEPTHTQVSTGESGASEASGASERRKYCGNKWKG